MRAEIDRHHTSGFKSQTTIITIEKFGIREVMLIYFGFLDKCPDSVVQI